MEQLTKQDLHYVIGSLPGDILDLARNHKIMIAGGFIREVIAGGTVNDIDIFGPSNDVLESACSHLVGLRGSTCKKHITENAITVLSPPRMPVQFIKRWHFDAPDKCSESFDFTVCQAVIWVDRSGNWCSCIASAFYSDLAAKRLVYTCPQRNDDAGGSMLRVQKFIKRGYSIQSTSLAKVIARITYGLPVASYEEALATNILARLVEVDPLRVIDGLELHDEHRSIPAE